MKPATPAKQVPAPILYLPRTVLFAHFPTLSIDSIAFADLASTEEGAKASLEFYDNGLTATLYKYTSLLSYIDAASCTRTTSRSVTMYRVVLDSSAGTLPLEFLHRLAEKGVSSDKYRNESSIVAYLNAIASTPILFI